MKRSQSHRVKSQTSSEQIYVRAAAQTPSSDSSSQSVPLIVMVIMVTQALQSEIAQCKPVQKPHDCILEVSRCSNEKSKVKKSLKWKGCWIFNKISFCLPLLKSQHNQNDFFSKSPTPCSGGQRQLMQNQASPYVSQCLYILHVSKQGLFNFPCYRRSCTFLTGGQEKSWRFGRNTVGSLVQHKAAPEPGLSTKADEQKNASLCLVLHRHTNGGPRWQSDSIVSTWGFHSVRPLLAPCSSLFFSWKTN